MFLHPLSSQSTMSYSMRSKNWESSTSSKFFCPSTFRHCSNVASATSTLRRAKWAHPHSFPSLIKEKVGSLAYPYLTGVAYRTTGNSVAVAYLPPTVLKRPNLTVAVSTIVERVLFDESGSEPRAVGVEVSKSPIAPKYRIKANREVIVCGGAIASPHILLVSGIGPKEVLSKAGIKVVKDLPQVGKNYRDVRLPLSYECSHDFTSESVYSTFRPVPFVCAPSLVTLLTFSIRPSRQFLRCCNGLSLERGQ